MKLDVLAFGAHPDDVELGCGGTIIKLVQEKRLVGIIDLTRGELGTRGTSETRTKESKKASRILGICLRENMEFKDGFFQKNDTNKLKLIKKIREHKPDIVITNAPSDRHPDHGRSSDLTIDACFLSGLEKIETKQKIWRPKFIYHYIQFNSLKPDFLIDISAQIEKKVEAIKAYKTQFYNPDSTERETIISSKEFLDSVKYRAQDLGRQSNCKFAEGFIANQLPKVNSFFDLK